MRTGPGAGVRWSASYAVLHHLGAVQPKSAPVAIVTGLRGRPNGESQHVAVEANRCGHIEDLQQWGHAVDIHGTSLRERQEYYQTNEPECRRDLE
jgi:hypothetical protein